MTLLRGIGSLGIPGKAIPPQILASQYVDFCVVRVHWDQIQPNELSMVATQHIAQQLASASANGKFVKLHVQAGIRTPQWVLDRVRTFSFVDGQNQPPRTIPVPWDSNYLRLLANMVRDIGRAVGDHPAIAAVGIDGVHSLTEETCLPRGQGINDQSSDLVAWRAFGYTRTRIEAAFQDIADMWDTASPGSSLCLEIVAEGLPPIDDAGNLIVSTTGQPRRGDELANAELIQTTHKRYPGSVNIQNNGLQPAWNSRQVDWAKSEGMHVGYQMLWRITPDPLDSTKRYEKMNGSRPGDLANNLLEACNRGIGAGAKYLEIYQPDLVEPWAQPVLAEVRAKLLA